MISDKRSGKILLAANTKRSQGGLLLFQVFGVGVLCAGGERGIEPATM